MPRAPARHAARLRYTRPTIDYSALRVPIARALDADTPEPSRVQRVHIKMAQRGAANL